LPPAPVFIERLELKLTKITGLLDDAIVGTT